MCGFLFYFSLDDHFNLVSFKSYECLNCVVIEIFWIPSGIIIIFQFLVRLQMRFFFRWGCNRDIFSVASGVLTAISFELQVRLQLRFYPVASVLVLILAAYLGSA
jgi:hypothetical protein